MKSTFIALAAASIVALLASCGSSTSRTGFLSDYSKLKKDSSDCYRYVDTGVLKGYNAVIVDPVEARLGQGEDSVTPAQVNELKNYTRSKMIAVVRAKGKKVVSSPGPGVGRLRIALTDIEESSAVNVLPQAAILGVGSGGVSMEAEVVDSVSKKQIVAVVQTGKGSHIPFANLGDMGAAKGVIDGWAKTLGKRLTE